MASSNTNDKDKAEAKATTAETTPETGTATTASINPLAPSPAPVAPGDPGVNQAGAVQEGVSVTPTPPAGAFRPDEVPPLDMGLVTQLAMAMAASQRVTTVPIIPTVGMDDGEARPYVINSRGQFVDANGNPVDPKLVHPEHKELAKRVKLNVPGVQFAEEEV